jgi:hypothetical protein
LSSCSWQTITSRYLSSLDFNSHSSGYNCIWTGQSINSSPGSCKDLQYRLCYTSPVGHIPHEPHSLGHADVCKGAGRAVSGPCTCKRWRQLWRIIPWQSCTASKAQSTLYRATRLLPSACVCCTLAYESFPAWLMLPCMMLGSVKRTAV